MTNHDAKVERDLDVVPSQNEISGKVRSDVDLANTYSKWVKHFSDKAYPVNATLSSFGRKFNVKKCPLSNKLLSYGNKYLLLYDHNKGFVEGNYLIVDENTGKGLFNLMLHTGLTLDKVAGMFKKIKF